MNRRTFEIHQRGRIDRQTLTPGGRGHAQRQRGVGERVRLWGEHDLLLVFGNARREHLEFRRLALAAGAR